MPCVERLVQQVPELQPAASQAGGVGVGTEALRYLLGEGVFNYSTQNWSHRWSCWRRKPSKLEKVPPQALQSPAVSGALHLQLLLVQH